MKEAHVFVYFEDDPMSQLVMELLLVRRLGYENVYIFGDSSDFMEKMNSLPKMPSIVFLDVHIHPYSGLEMLQMLRQSTQFGDVTVIAVTASVMNEEVVMLKDAGLNGAISKPINQDTFADSVVQILQGLEVWSIA